MSLSTTSPIHVDNPDLFLSYIMKGSLRRAFTYDNMISVEFLFAAIEKALGSNYSVSDLREITSTEKTQNQEEGGKWVELTFVFFSWKPVSLYIPKNIDFLSTRESQRTQLELSLEQQLDVPEWQKSSSWGNIIQNVKTFLYNLI